MILGAFRSHHRASGNSLSAVRTRNSGVEALGAQVSIALLDLGVHGTRHRASFSRGIRIRLAGFARHAHGWLVFLIVPDAPGFVTFARPIARLAQDILNKFAILPTETAYVLSLLLLLAVQNRMFLLVARLAVTVITGLSLRGLLTTAGFVIPFAVLDRLSSTRSTNKSPTEDQVERQAEHAEKKHR